MSVKVEGIGISDFETNPVGTKDLTLKLIEKMEQSLDTGCYFCEHRAIEGSCIVIPHEEFCPVGIFLRKVT